VLFPCDWKISATTPASGSKNSSFTVSQPPNFVMSNSFGGSGKSCFDSTPSTTGR
jgi:hypothetical protein